jgi:NitT/TauT family transport system permease protein
MSYVKLLDRILPLLVIILALALWLGLMRSGILNDKIVPWPQDVMRGLGEEIASRRLLRDIIASVFRVTVGFTLAVALGVPVGLLLGNNRVARAALLPGLNFFRSLSPLAWIPFAILWFGMGDTPAIFLIFLATLFPLALATMSAVANIPSVYFRVAHDYGLRGSQLLFQVTLPAILPQLITALRVTAGVAWLVVVAAEMLAGDSGLGFAIWDARNGLRNDILVAEMLVIGCIGVLIDRLLMRLTLEKSVRWGYER